MCYLSKKPSLLRAKRFRVLRYGLDRKQANQSVIQANLTDIQANRSSDIQILSNGSNRSDILQFRLTGEQTFTMISLNNLVSG